MSRPRIKYVCYYHSLEPNKPRECVQAATTKIDYTISVLNRIGYDVDIISPAIISAKKICFSAGGTNKIDCNTLRHFPSFGFLSSRYFRYLSRKITNFYFKRYLTNNINTGEQIIVYHSIGYCSQLLELKKKIGFKLIGEIEEIYQDVHPQTPKLNNDEYSFCVESEKYIFPNAVLNEKINTQNRPYLVIHGLYNIQLVTERRFDDGKIHVLYSGTFDPVKGGAHATLEMAQYLPSNYHVHVTGFGNENQVKMVSEKYSQIRGHTECDVTYHGFISREELNTLMQKCHIGLCTQDPTKELNLTSFPSKILNYMSNGLVVLSGCNRAIEESAVGDLVYYYNEHTPEVIASAIVEIRTPNGDKCKERLRMLDKEFENNLRELL